jgi:hypothetical protein
MDQKKRKLEDDDKDQKNLEKKTKYDLGSFEEIKRKYHEKLYDLEKLLISRYAPKDVPFYISYERVSFDTDFSEYIYVELFDILHGKLPFAIGVEDRLKQCMIHLYYCVATNAPYEVCKDTVDYLLKNRPICEMEDMFEIGKDIAIKYKINENKYLIDSIKDGCNTSLLVLMSNQVFPSEEILMEFLQNTQRLHIFQILYSYDYVALKSEYLNNIPMYPRCFDYFLKLTVDNDSNFIYLADKCYNFRFFDDEDEKTNDRKSGIISPIQLVDDGTELLRELRMGYLVGAAVIFLHHEEKDCTFEVRMMIKQYLVEMYDHDSDKFDICREQFNKSINCTLCQSEDTDEYDHYIANLKNEIALDLPKEIYNIILNYVNTTTLKH